MGDNVWSGSISTKASSENKVSAESKKTTIKVAEAGTSVDMGNPTLKSPFKNDIPWDPNPNKVDYNVIFILFLSIGKWQCCTIL
mmetsp:Transcript_27563/g.52025  ORF Transcript_27563/g.52025 Transcript_27563/m.52025 type:complete len:84 (+) Transcript_27563:15-266(+)